MKRASFYKTQSVARNTIYVMVSQLVINITAVFVGGYVARTLGVQDYGKFVFAFSFVQTFTLISNMGIHVVQVREIAKDKENAAEFFGSTLMFRVFFASITYGLIVLTITMLDYPPITKQIVYIAGISLIFTYIGDSCTAAFKAYEKMQFMALINIIMTLVSMFLRVTVLYMGYKLLALSWTMAVISILSASVPYIVLRRYFFKPKFVFNIKKLKDIFFVTLPFYFGSFFMVLYKKVDVLLLSFIMGDAHVAWYNAAFLLTSRLSFVSSAIVSAVFPVISRLTADNRKEESVKIYRKGLFILFLLGLPIAVGTSILAEDIILLIYGKQYAEAIIILRILAWTVPLVFMSQIMNNTLNAFNKEKTAAKIIACYVVVNIASNLILIPRLGYVGAAISLILSELVNFILNFINVSAVIKAWSFESAYIKIIAAGLVMAVTTHLLSQYNLALVILLSSVIYLTALFVLRAITPHTVSQIKDMVFKNQKT